MIHFNDNGKLMKLLGEEINECQFCHATLPIATKQQIEEALENQEMGVYYGSIYAVTCKDCGEDTLLYTKRCGDSMTPDNLYYLLGHAFSSGDSSFVGGLGLYSVNIWFSYGSSHPYRRVRVVDSGLITMKVHLRGGELDRIYVKVGCREFTVIRGVTGTWRARRGTEYGFHAKGDNLILDVTTDSINRTIRIVSDFTAKLANGSTYEDAILSMAKRV